MPPAKKIKGSGLKDTWGRNNRKHADKTCLECGAIYRPKRASAKYCSRPCMWKNNGKHKVRQPFVWWKNSKGYIEGRVTKDGVTKHYKQHRYIMQEHLGRELMPDEDVHHINGVKDDNRIENLQVLNHGEHTKITNSERQYRTGRKNKMSDDERAARSKRAIKLHKQGKLMTPQARAALSKALGQDTSNGEG